MKHALVLVATVLLGVFSKAAISSDSPAESGAQRLEALLAAMGGRELWAKTVAMRIDATHYEANLQHPYENRIFISFESPRIRIEAQSEAIRRVRAVVGDSGWHVSEKAPLQTMTAAQVESDLQWWDAHIYRTVQRLARRDPTLTAASADDGRLLIKRSDGSQLMWVRQNVSGEPLQFGVGEAGTGTVFGPLLPGPGIKIPRFSVSPDGTWRALINAIEANPDLSRVNFSQP